MVKELWDRVESSERDDQDSRHQGGTCRQSKSAIYQGIQHQRHVDLLGSRCTRRPRSRTSKGLRRRLAEGKPIDKIRSVNSVFVSRIDTAVDKLLQDRIAKGEKLDHLLGKTGIAGLKLTYQKFKEIFEGEEFAPLKAAGGAVQRPLWASTSTKNPHYPDLMYVENVVGPDTVNTMPPVTLDALLDHGKVVPDTVESDSARRSRRDARAARSEDLALRGNRSTAGRGRRTLLRFVRRTAWVRSSTSRSCSLRAARSASGFRLEHHKRHMTARSDRLASADFLKRLWAHDATLWSSDPARRGDHQEIAGMARRPAAHARGSCRPEGIRERKPKSSLTSPSSAAWAAARSRPTSLPIPSDRWRHIRISTCSTRPPRSRSKSSKVRSHIPINALHHLEQKRDDDRAERVLRVLSRKSLQRTRRLRRGTKLRRDHRSRYDAR